MIFFGGLNPSTNEKAKRLIIKIIRVIINTEYRLNGI